MFPTRWPEPAVQGAKVGSLAAQSRFWEFVWALERSKALGMIDDVVHLPPWTSHNQACSSVAGCEASKEPRSCASSTIPSQGEDGFDVCPRVQICSLSSEGRATCMVNGQIINHASLQGRLLDHMTCEPQARARSWIQFKLGRWCY